jgi:hypothetical protein
MREDKIKGYRYRQLTNRTTRSESFDRVHGFDPEDPNIELGTTTLTWETPSYHAPTGVAAFSWSVVRDNWPVQWTVSNGTIDRLVINDTMDFIDTYKLEIDTVAGIATLENGYKQSVVANSTLAAMVADLSLATYHRDLFLSVSALKKGMDGAVGQPTAATDIKIGDVSVATAVFGDTKASYTIGDPPIENTSLTSVLNLLTMSGQIGDTSTIESSGWNPFISPLAQRVALGLVHVTAHSLGTLYGGNVAWQLSENIVITSYPLWGGDGPLVHDPTFTATFSPEEAEESSSEPATDTDTASEPEPESTPAAASAAGVVVVGSLFIALGISRRYMRK